MTQKYYGSKIVTAWPAEQNSEAGYAVKYEDGYTSWSPKNIFEAAYIPMGNTESLAGWQERIVAEMVQLHDRTLKLGGFLLSPAAANLEDASRELLEQQLKIMKDYKAVLLLRCKLHGITDVWNGPES